jgi:hypothetical protein
MVKIPMFKIGTVARGPKSYAKLRSIAPLLDLPFEDGFSWYSQEVVSQLYALVRLRRSALFRLSSAGWNRAQHEWERLFSCPPTGAYVLPTSRECRVDYFCPFCWVRHVTAKLYDHVAWAVFGTNQLQYSVTPIRIVDLVLLRRQIRIALSDYEDPKQIFYDVRTVAKTVCQSRLRGDTLGASSLATLQPDTRYSKDVLLSEAILAIGIPGLRVSDLCDEFGFTAKRLKFQNLSPFDVADMVGVACEYPANLLFGSTDVTHSILKVRSHKRRDLRRPPRMAQYWGYLQQFPIFKFDIKCHLAYQENYTDAIKPNTSAALRGVPT